MHVLKKFLLLPAPNRSMLVKVFFLVVMIRFGIKMLPFHKLLRLLNWLAVPSQGKPSPDPHYQRRVVWAASAIARRLLRESPCLTQALTVQLLFRRKGIPAELRIGVAKDEEGLLKAHAWVESNNKIVIGGANSPFEYEVFSSLDPARR